MDPWRCDHRTNNIIYTSWLDRFAGKLAPNELIDARLELARRSRYALMGVGLHGVNGLSPSIAVNIYNVYIMPRYTYNLDVSTLTKSQVDKLEMFHRKTLRSIQGLPDRTSSAITYLLLGSMPLEGTLDTHVLALFGRIMKGDSPLLYNLLLRQLALKDFTSKSWFIHLVRLCGKYDLPLPHRLVDGSITPQSWNSLVKRTVFSFWFRTMSQDVITKSTLRFISIDLLFPGKVHPVWAHVYSNTRDIVRAHIKVKLLTGSYTLQSNRARFNNNSVYPTCLLCGTEDEHCAFPDCVSIIRSYQTEVHYQATADLSHSYFHSYTIRLKFCSLRGHHICRRYTSVGAVCKDSLLLSTYSSFPFAGTA